MSNQNIGYNFCVRSNDAHGFLTYVTETFGNCAAPAFIKADPKNENNIVHASVTVNGRGIYISSEESDKDVDAKVFLYLPVKDPYATEKAALAAGATSVVKVAKQYWGSDYGVVKSPGGIYWSISCRFENADNAELTEEEARKLVADISAKDPFKEIEFLEKAFGAVQLQVMKDEKSGKMMHGEVKLNQGGYLYLCSQFENESDQATITINYESAPGDAEKILTKLANFGGKVTMPAGLQFWGDVYGRCEDRFGNEWAVIERHFDFKDLSPIHLLGETGADVPFTKLSDFFGSALPGSSKVAEKISAVPVGPITSFYTNFEPSKDGAEHPASFSLTAGVPVDAGVKVGAEHHPFKVRSIHGRKKMAYTVLHGDYSGLPKQWAKLVGWAKGKGLKIGSPAVEVYHGQQDKPETLWTEIYATTVSEEGKDNGCTGSKN